MLNRYQGNTGRVVRIDDGQPKPAPPRPPRPGLMQPKPPGIFDKLTQLVPGSLGELETEDIILLLILILCTARAATASC